MDTSTQMNQQAALMQHMGPFMLVFVILCIAIYLIPAWQIVKKAGFSPVLSLLLLIPLVNLIMIYVFAFSSWKVVPAASASASLQD